MLKEKGCYLERRGLVMEGYRQQRTIDRIEEYKKRIEGYRFRIYKANTMEEQVELLKEVYQMVKELSTKMYQKEKGFSKQYYTILESVLSIEDHIKQGYIMDVKPNYGYTKEKKKEDVASNEHIIQAIADTIRVTLCRKLNKKYGSKKQPIESFDLQGYCPISADMVKQIGDAFSIQTTKVTIEPGFLKDSPLFNQRKKHCCSLVKVNDELYLVDCTYAQFFLQRDCILERLGIPMLSGCAPGTFMLMDEMRRSVAEKLLKDGWIKATPQVLKAYMDGFALSFRNGLYYEETGDFSYTTNYTAEDYIRFLFGEDNQLHHEESSYLGFQNKPLKNIHMSFLPQTLKMFK